MIRRLRVLSAAAGLGLMVSCGSPSAPDIPAPDPDDDPDDPKTGIIAVQISGSNSGFRIA